MASGLSRRRFRCTECGNCCRGPRVPVTHADLARLAAATGTGLERFVEWLAPSQVDMTGEPSSFVELDCGRRLMVLRHEAGACRLLTGDRCAVHAARPRACRTYPLEASFGKRGGVHRLRIVTRDVECRYELDGHTPESSLRAEHAALARELACHQALVSIWNREQRRRRRMQRRVHGAPEFLAFLEARGERAA